MRLLLSGGGTGGHVYPILAVLAAFEQAALPQNGALAPAAPSSVAASSPSRQPAPRVPTDFPAASPAPSVPSPAKPAPAAAAPSQTASASRAAADPAQPELLYVGIADSVEQELAARAGVPFRPIDSGQMRGMGLLTTMRNLLKVGRGAGQAARIIKDFRPDAVFVTGGFVAGPVVWAAWRAHVPVLIYLPDVEPGIAIRRMSRMAARVAVSFPEVAAWFPGKAVVTGYPVRSDILHLAGQRRAAKASLGLMQDLPALLVFGGSRGARSINQALGAALPALLPHCQIVHISGTLDWPAVEAQASALPAEMQARYHAFPYLHDEMATALAAADLVLARAGASTLGEFPALSLPSLLVPYPYSGQHQDVNADYLVQHGAALKLADAQLAQTLAPTVLTLLNDPARLAGMSAAAGALARPDAAAAIARELRQLAQSPAARSA